MGTTLIKKLNIETKVRSMRANVLTVGLKNHIHNLDTPSLITLPFFVFF